jgi:hydroxyethylthiazole kinase-like uncharacterized protein yjeF
MRVLTVEEMRRVETATDESGRTYAEMMEQAGHGVAQAIQTRVDVEGKRVLALVGPGNNGGDGLVAARYLAEAGADVACYLLKPRDQDDPNLQAVQELEISVADATNDQGWRVLRELVMGAHVVIDALLGTGTRLPLEGALAQLLSQVKEGLTARRTAQVDARALRWPARLPEAPVRCLVVAVDGPSGLDFDTGELDVHSLEADLTVTFAFPKQGHFLSPGGAGCGDLVVADIGVDPDLVQRLLGDAALEVATPEMIAERLPARSSESHKGTYGKALLVVGSINYTGAAYLSASAATRVGAGLVTLGVPATIHGALASKISEATYLILPQAMGVIAPGAVEVLLENVGDYDAMLLGCGLSHEKETQEFLDKLLHAETQTVHKGRIGFAAEPRNTVEEPEEGVELPPLVVDADGLNILAGWDEEWWKLLPNEAILTPHPGEMSRLIAKGIKEIQADRIGVAREMASTWGHVVVLKGAFTVIAAPDGRVVILPFATSALASAGTGDVLAGSIVGLLAQGVKPFDAALVAGYVHGLAGLWAGEEVGLAGTVASDLLPRLPRAIREITRRA